MNKVIATLAAGTIVLGACGLTSVSTDELREQLIEDDFSEALADCIVDTLEADLTDDQFQDVAQADEIDELDADLAQQATSIIQACVLAEG